MFAFPTGPRVMALAADWLASAEAAVVTLSRGRDVRTIGASLSDYVDATGRVVDRPYQIVDGAAIIPVSGLLLERFPYIGYSGATGYDALRLQTAVALTDPAVRGLLYDINSGGGDAAGMVDLSRWIATSAAAAGKPTASVLISTACSAAYGLACATQSIAMPDCGSVGSIGALRVHFDVSGLLAEAGVKVSLITSDPHKADGNPYEPLPDGVAGDWTEIVGSVRDSFAAWVAERRPMTLDAIRGTEARVYSGPVGASRALSLGLVDAVAPSAEAATAFFDFINNQGV